MSAIDKRRIKRERKNNLHENYNMEDKPCSEK